MLQYTHLMKQIKHINIIWLMTDMFLKKFVDGGFYKEEIIDSNIAHTCLHRYKVKMSVVVKWRLLKENLQKKFRKLFLNDTFHRLTLQNKSTPFPLHQQIFSAIKLHPKTKGNKGHSIWRIKFTFLYQQSLPRLVKDSSMMSSATRKNACNWNKEQKNGSIPINVVLSNKTKVNSWSYDVKLFKSIPIPHTIQV